MSIILATKLHIPAPRPELVHRARLLQRLEQGLSGKLTLLSASAGFGKTTLLSDWCSRLQRPVAWLSLHKMDNEPLRFLTYLVSALQTVEESVGQSVLNALQSPQPPTPDALLPPLLNDLSAVSRPFLLVLDDLHLLDSPELDDFLGFFLEHLPSTLHLVIATREDPQFSLSRLRVRGELNELRASELRFTSEEASDFLKEVTGLSIREDELHALTERTEGWIAGLQLAALSMRGHSDVTGFVDAFAGSHRFVLDYLLEEVLRQQPEEVREFLLQTSLLQRLSASLCNAVTGRNDSQKMLERLEQSNLFVIALDHTRQWYRYHHLFADALRLTLQHQYPEDIASFHQRASVWYEQNGWMSDAIEHVLKAEDYERTADLLEAVWPEMNDQYQTAAWKHWAFQLPEHLLHQSPLLCSNLGWSTLMAGQLEPSQRWFSRAERWLQSSESEQLSMRVSQPDLFAQLPITLNVAGAYKSLFLGDFDATLDYTGAALAAVTDEEDKALHHLQATSMAGIALWGRGDLLEAEQVMSELVARQHAMNRTSYAIELTFLVADIRLARGQSRAACHAFDTAFLWLKERGEPLLMGLEDLHRGVADLYCLWDRLEEAEEHLYKAEELEKQLVQRPNWKQRVTLSWVFLQTARGELDKALNLLQQAREHSLQAPLPEPEPLDAHEVRLWIRQGRLDEAEQWVQQQQLSVEMELTFLNTFKALTFARLLLARGRQQRSNENFAACHLLCERVRATSQKRGHFYRVMEAELLLALVCHETGEGLQAREHLQKSLALAEPEGIIQLYAQEGATLHTLLSQKPALEISDVFLQRLLKKSGSSATTAPSLSSVSPVSSTLPEPLTERELDVLRWLQTELTGPEIAKEMFVSLSTVRTHTRNLYSKLNTSNRRAAVNRAKELGIL